MLLTSQRRPLLREWVWQTIFQTQSNTGRFPWRWTTLYGAAGDLARRKSNLLWCLQFTYITSITIFVIGAFVHHRVHSGTCLVPPRAPPSPHRVWQIIKQQYNSCYYYQTLYINTLELWVGVGLFVLFHNRSLARSRENRTGRSFGQSISWSIHCFADNFANRRRKRRIFCVCFGRHHTIQSLFYILMR